MTEPEKLPLLYKDMTPLNAESHGGYGVTGARSFAFAADLGYAPLTMEEFGTAQRFYPIVFTREAPATPVALFSAKRDANAFVGEDGAWRDGAYVPAYLRRYPFMFVKRSAEANDRVLCADMTSSLLEDGVEDENRLLFKDGAAGPAGEKALELCKAHELATERTKRAVAVLEEHDLFQDSAIEVQSEGRKSRVDGFRIISEQKLRELDNEAVLNLVRKGAIGPIYAHLFSLSNFASLGRP
ncbi:MAG: SapC family protein [Pseudomonadota bacterium]